MRRRWLARAGWVLLVLVILAAAAVGVYAAYRSGGGR